MATIITQNTTLAQWYDLVMEAEGLRHVNLHQDVESYLVFLLMRFTERPEFADSVVALDFLDALSSGRSERQGILRDVGDKCLLFSGFFPGRAKRKLVSPHYFVDVGQAAYATLAAEEAILAQLYNSLTAGFMSLVSVLHAVRETAQVNSIIPQ